MSLLIRRQVLKLLKQYCIP